MSPYLCVAQTESQQQSQNRSNSHQLISESVPQELLKMAPGDVRLEDKGGNVPARRTESKMKMSATKSENQLVEAEEIGGVPLQASPHQ